jgi:pimeloyl-ACP methyl ester carboxylesterase
VAAVRANGITIEYDSTGSGDPVLLIMGLGEQTTTWPDAFVAKPGCEPAEQRKIAQRNVERSFRPAAVARQTAAIMASPDRTDALSGVGIPMLVVHGLLDRLVKPSGGMATARTIPGSRLIMYPDMAHDLPRARWAELVSEIRRNADRA